MFMFKLEFRITRRIDLCELRAAIMDSRLNELRNVDLRNKVYAIKEEKERGKSSNLLRRFYQR